MEQAGGFGLATAGGANAWEWNGKLPAASEEGLEGKGMEVGGIGLFSEHPTRQHLTTNTD